MSKRFTDTEIWKKQWFTDLSPRLKCLWVYLLANCDHAGVWDSNFGLASYLISEPVSTEDLEAFGDRIEMLENGKYYLNTFIDFQYGKLSESCKAHNPVFKSLKKNQINKRVSPDPDFIGKTNNVSPKTRAFVIERDKKTCAYCEKLCSNFDLVLDHVVPRSSNGSDKSENLVVSCRRCNLKKSDFSLEDFIKRNNLPERVLERVTETLSHTHKDKDKDKDKVKDKVKDKEKDMMTGKDFFPAFWEAYPHKPDDSKYTAEQQFNHLVDYESVSPDEIITGAENYAGYVQDQGTLSKYITKASRWLDERTWQGFQVKPEKPKSKTQLRLERAVELSKREDTLG